jgi:integrase
VYASATIKRLAVHLSPPCSFQAAIKDSKRDKVWRFYWWEDGKRKSRALGRFPTKTAAWKAAKPLRDALEAPKPVSKAAPTVNTLVKQYRLEKMPKRKDTRGGYESWLRVYITPKWGDAQITDLQARNVEMWLESLGVDSKTKVIHTVVATAANIADSTVLQELLP